MQIVQLNETDALALQLGGLILRGISAASKLDATLNELADIKQELKKLKEALDPSVAESDKSKTE